jgi:hypothetical protein
MPSLLELQRQMQAQLWRPAGLDGVDGVDGLDGLHGARASLAPGASLELALRIGIYRNTCIGTLVNALRLSFPAVRRLVGADFFEAAARSFIEQSVPRSAYLDEYGADFPAFLAAFPPAATLVYLSDVAQLEWAVSRVLHADDAAGVSLAQLSALGEAAWPAMSFVPHPALSLLQSQHPADLIWRAVLEQDEAAMASIDPAPGTVYLLIERDTSGLAVRRLAAAAWHFTSALCAGRPLYAALGDVPDEQNHAILAEHLARGRFIQFRLNDPPSAACEAPHSPERPAAHSPGRSPEHLPGDAPL